MIQNGDAKCGRHRRNSSIDEKTISEDDITYPTVIYTMLHETDFSLLIMFFS